MLISLTQVETFKIWDRREGKTRSCGITISPQRANLTIPNLLFVITSPFRVNPIITNLGFSPLADNFTFQVC